MTSIKKYKFSAAPKLYMINDNMQDARREEIHPFLAEMRRFGIKPTDISSSIPSLRMRNVILNVVYSILDDEDLCSFINEKKCLPIKKISRIAGELPEMISQYRNYIILYFVILNSEKYVNLRNYLSIEEDDKSGSDEKKVKDAPITGVLLLNSKSGSFVLTNTGEIRCITPSCGEDSKPSIGSIIEGSKIKRLNCKKIAILGSAIIIALSLIIATSIYKTTTSKIVMNFGYKGSISISVNPFGRVFDVSGSGSATRKAVSSVKYNGRQLDSVMCDILSYGFENNLLGDSNDVLIYITKNPIDFSKMDNTVDYIKLHKIDANINNNGSDMFIDISQQ